MSVLLFREDAPELLERLVGVVLELGCLFFETLTSSSLFSSGITQPPFVLTYFAIVIRTVE